MNWCDPIVGRYFHSFFCAGWIAPLVWVAAWIFDRLAGGRLYALPLWIVSLFAISFLAMCPLNGLELRAGLLNYYNLWRSSGWGALSFSSPGWHGWALTALLDELSFLTPFFWLCFLVSAVYFFMNFHVNNSGKIYVVAMMPLVVYLCAGRGGSPPPWEDYNVLKAYEAGNSPIEGFLWVKDGLDNETFFMLTSRLADAQALSPLSAAQTPPSAAGEAARCLWRLQAGAMVLKTEGGGWMPDMSCFPGRVDGSVQGRSMLDIMKGKAIAGKAIASSNFPEEMDRARSRFQRAFFATPFGSNFLMNSLCSRW